MKSINEMLKHLEEGDWCELKMATEAKDKIWVHRVRAQIKILREIEAELTARIEELKDKTSHACRQNMKWCFDCEWIYCSICGKILGDFEHGNVNENRTHSQIHEEFGFNSPKADKSMLELLRSVKAEVEALVIQFNTPETRHFAKKLLRGGGE